MTEKPQICSILRQVAQILQIKGDNPFRIRAYERAAQNIEGLTGDLEKFIQEDKLLEIPGIGKDLADRIKEIAGTGRLKLLEGLKKTIPPGLLGLLDIPSVGPKTAKLLYEQLRIKSIADLQRAIKKGRLQGLFGIKEKTIENIAKGIEILKRGKERLPLAAALGVAGEFIAPLERLSEAKQVLACGSLRRRKETVRDIDILAVSKQPEKAMDVFTQNPAVREVKAKGATKASVRTAGDVQVDCRVVGGKSFGAAALYFTGSKSFNIKLRMLAIKKGLKINEYGVFRKDRFICGRTEGEIFKTLGLSYIEPELREDTGEIELAGKSELPELIEMEDIKGDFHAHSTWSDGLSSIEEMAKAAKGLGYSYIAITDHSQSLKVAGGMKVADLKKKKAEIEKINKNLKNFRVLFGSEVDIDAGGRLDYSDEVLKEFDLVVAAIHSGFKQSKEQLTRRIVRACQNKYVHIIAHPTGQLWASREPYDLDFEAVLEASGDTHTALEINAFSDRLDLDSQHCRRAKEAGVKLAIGTDAHKTGHLSAMQLGVWVARRGWLGPQDVLNTLSVDKLLKEIKKR